MYNLGINRRKHATATTPSFNKNSPTQITSRNTKRCSFRLIKPSFPASTWQHFTVYLLGLGIGTVFGNVTFLAAIVTSFVSGGFSTVSGDVAHSTTVEAAPVLGSGFVNHLSIFSFQACVLAIPCDMSCLQDDKSKRKSG